MDVPVRILLSALAGLGAWILTSKNVKVEVKKVVEEIVPAKVEDVPVEDDKSGA